MYTSEMLICSCVYVHIHIYTTGLFRRGHPQARGSINVHIQNVYAACISCVYVYIRIYTITIASRETSEGSSEARGYIHLHIRNACIYMYICT